MDRQRLRLIVLLALAGLAGCLPSPTHRCDADEDCPAGSCEVVIGDDQRCALDDSDCDSGQRWADDAGDVAGACVDGSAPALWNPCLVQPAIRETDACAAAVCAEYSRCCSREWSDTCVMLADRECGSRCGEVAAFVGANETWVGAWSGDDYVAFWADDVAGRLVEAVTWGDYDFDLLPDLATCDDGGGGDPGIRIYHNEGGDDLSLIKVVPYARVCTDLDFVDFDDDGDLDLVVGSVLEAILIANDGGLWADPALDVIPGFVFDLDWADVDGDGILDPAVARYKNTVAVFGNDGGALSLLYDTPEVERFQSVSWGEVNGVGGLDLLIGGDSLLRVLDNTAVESFATDTTPLFEGPVDAVASSLLLDVDDDHDLDIVALYEFAPMRVFRNDHDSGSGTGFTSTPLWTSGAGPPFDAPGIELLRLVAADVDGDRHVDLLACAEGDYCRLWLGDGAGSFAPEWNPDGPRAITGVAVTGDWR